MNVLLVSQCDKRALVETRRILDQFAERRGDRTWQTSITQAGLDTLRKLLRKTARKNTAVACHWIRGRDYSELLWIVGDARQFNAEGAVPTNSTESDVLRREDENDWHSLRTIHRLSALASLLHDLGKACLSFQNRLLPSSPRHKNRYRHEWVSVRLFQAFVGRDDDATWLQRLVDAAGGEVDGEVFQACWLDRKNKRLLCDGLDEAANSNKPFASSGGLPQLAQAIAWLVLTHHRLPAMPCSATEAQPSRLWHGRPIPGVSSGELVAVMDRIDAEWNEPWGNKPLDRDADRVSDYWTFPHGLPVRTAKWRGRAGRIARGLLQDLQGASGSLHDPYIMHLSRLSLMLGDHHYSSLEALNERVQGDTGFPLFANTSRETGKLLQPLDEHLLGVEWHASHIVHSLPALDRHLSHLIGHRGLKKRGTDPVFRWQDKAADLAAAVRQSALNYGAFVVDMASTGCGKTLGNARIMNALADPAKGFRCAFAMGLRTLTLQTGRVFQTDLGLSDEDLAIRVGGAPGRGLFEYYEDLAERSGSASRQALLDETAHVVYEGDDRNPVLAHLRGDPDACRLVAAPLLVCTVDHLTPATEGLRGGRQIAPMLRLLTGDLVLDEPDDFDMDDLPALTRLVHWAGLLGAKVLLSSATLPPALVQGLFAAYLEGRRWFQRNRGEQLSAVASVCCLWVDEFFQNHADCPDVESFYQHHQAFAQSRVLKLGEQPVRRCAQLLALPKVFQSLDRERRRLEFASVLQKAALQMHEWHCVVDPKSGKRVSFGLIRMANIGPLYDVALNLFRLGVPSEIHIHLCVYHSQFPLFLRSRIEYQLDRVLDRRKENAVFDLPAVRRAVDAESARDQLFVVLGSPVTEVGRDHDYDWAVVEPSSMRSFIQLAGRVWRHRRDRVLGHPNLLICSGNLKQFDRPREPAYCHPGFESSGFCLRPHELRTLLSPWLDGECRMPIDSRLRVVSRPDAVRRPGSNLVDLEHVRMEHQMLQAGDRVLNAASFWARGGANLTGVMQQVQEFRKSVRPEVEVVWRPNGDGQVGLFRVEGGDRKVQKLYVPIGESQCQNVPDDAVRGDGVSPWLVGDLEQMMAEQSEDMDLSLDGFALKYARATLLDSERGWFWHSALGFTERA
jgi:CRISPR-associated endonuclease/helicase Cas3